jgi:hypothetical protein
METVQILNYRIAQNSRRMDSQLHDDWTEATEESMNHKYIENWMSQKANLHMFSLFGQPKTGLKNN